MSGERRELCLSPPRKITEGPTYTYRKVPWLPLQNFYRVSDIDNDIAYYCTSVEARMKCGVRIARFNTAVEKRNLISDRWLIEKIPKFLFIKRTGRETDIRREYYWKW